MGVGGGLGSEDHELVGRDWMPVRWVWDSQEL